MSDNNLQSPTVQMIRDHLTVVGLSILGIGFLANFFTGSQGFNKETFQIEECVITQEEVDDQNVYECQYLLNDSPDPDRRQFRKLLVKGVVEHSDEFWTRAVSLLVKLDPSTGEIETNRFGVVEPLNVTPVELQEEVSVNNRVCFVILNPEESKSPTGWFFTQDPSGNWLLKERKAALFDLYSNPQGNYDNEVPYDTHWYFYTQLNSQGRIRSLSEQSFLEGVEPCTDYSADYSELDQDDLSMFEFIVPKDKVPSDLDTLGDLPDLLRLQS